MARIAVSILLAACFAFTANASVPETPVARDVSTTSAPARCASAANETRYFVSFGDSYSQTGFNVSGSKPSAANPLGNPTLPGWTASGGLNWVGFLTAKFNASLLLSYNFASGGATTDASLITPYASTVFSFIDQVAQFNASLGTKPSYAPWTATNTIVGVWMGVNDVGNSFWLETKEELLTKVLTKYFEQLQILYDAGLRNFALLGVPPTQLSPLMLKNGADSNAQLASAIQTYNDLLTSNVAKFKAANSGATAWIVDTTAPFKAAIENPTAYGSPDATCFQSDGVSCLWFNDYHPGVAINELVGKAVAKTVGAPWFTA